MVNGKTENQFLEFQMSSNVSLLILAGGIGSRYQSSKQIDAVGPSGQFLLEYSIYDAINAGFNKIVLVVNNKVEELLRLKLSYLESHLNVVYVNQDKYSLDLPVNRTKPWGTGHAVLVAQEVVDEPFMVVNADDFYGPNAFKFGYHFLTSKEISSLQMGMIAYSLKNTLSKHGLVSRGICKVDSNGDLLTIQEHSSISANKGEIISYLDGEIVLEKDSLVSMNSWLFHPSIFKELAIDFRRFCSINLDSTTKEYFLPEIVQKSILNKKMKVSLLKTTDKWMGLTYLKDKDDVVEVFKKLTINKTYPISFNE